MCINPVLLPNGQQVACHKCWQCRRRKIDDWQGRCIAEGKHCAAVHAVTLTYGRDRHYDAVDHVKAAVLTYSDVQKYLKSWRAEGYAVRYFVVGEYGPMKGRAHWHILLFWGFHVPERELGKNIECPMWEHGHSYWQMGTPETVAYVCKYIAKEVAGEEADELRQYHMGLSKYPPLGDAYFRLLARQHVLQRLAPQDLFYSFDGVLDSKGKKKKFVIQGVSRENFLRYFTEGWWDLWGDHPPNSELLEAFDDDQALKGSPDEARRILAGEKAKVPGYRDVVKQTHFTGVVSKPTNDDLRRWMIPQRLKFSESLNVWLYQFEGGQSPWYWAKDASGSYGWREKIGGGAIYTNGQSYGDVSRGK